MKFGRRSWLVACVAVAVIISALGWGLVTTANKSTDSIVNHIAPPLAIRSYGGGQTVDVAGLRGRAVVLNFWASWCLYCRKEAPMLNAEAQQSQGRVAFVGADIEDSAAAATRYLAEYHVRYPSGPIIKGNRYAFRVTAPPETFFISRQGTIIFSIGGPVSHRQLLIGVQQLSQ